MARSGDQVTPIEVRKYEAGDRAAIRSIAVATALTGSPGAAFIDGEEILADALTLYFTDYEPQSSFVATRDGAVVGYITGAMDTRAMERIFWRRIVWPLSCKILRSGFFLRAKNIALLKRMAASLFRGEFHTPDFFDRYPATLHINLSDHARGQDAGTALMQAYLSYLRENNVSGVRMATMSSGSADFFRKQGFSPLFEGRRSYFRHVLGGDVPLYIFGKIIG